MKGVVQLLDLPDELLLNILKKVDCQASLLCSMIDIEVMIVWSNLHLIDVILLIYPRIFIKQNIDRLRINFILMLCLVFVMTFVH